MVLTQVTLTDEEAAAIRRIAEQSSRKDEEVIHLAIGLLIGSKHEGSKLEKLRAARGIWQDRTDLPDVGTLRARFDRF